MKYLLTLLCTAIQFTAISQDWKEYYVERDLKEANALFNIYSLDTIIKTETKWIVKYKIAKQEFKAAPDGGRYIPGPGCKFCGMSFCDLELRRVKYGVHTEVTEQGDLIQWFDKIWEGKTKIVVPAPEIRWSYGGYINNRFNLLKYGIVIEPYPGDNQQTSKIY